MQIFNGPPDLSGWAVVLFCHPVRKRDDIPSNCYIAHPCECPRIRDLLTSPHGG